jgi:hypothetical protein
MSLSGDYPPELKLEQQRDGRWRLTVRGPLTSVAGESSVPDYLRVMADAYAAKRRADAARNAGEAGAR